jgi:hypothetical protein
LGGAHMSHSIYVLRDQCDGAVRYVGLSVDPDARFLGHIKEAKRQGHKTRRTAWLCKCVTAGVIPRIEVLMVFVDRADAQHAERLVIAWYRLAGHQLVNVADGGDGQAPGYVWSDAAKSKASLAHKLRYKDPRERSKTGEQSKRAWSVERRMRHSALMKVRYRDPANRALTSSTLKGKKRSEATRQRMLEAMYRRWSNPVERARHSEACKRRFKTEAA